MPFGRLIRVSKRGDPRRIAYIVAVRGPTKAVDLIREKVGGPDDEIEDFGRVSDDLLKALNLMPGEFIRADDPQKRAFGSDR